MLPRRTSFRGRGVTLLEVLLSMGFLVLLTSMTYWFYFSVLDTGRRGRTESHNLRLVRVALNRIAKEIRQVSAITTDNRVGLRGEPERIWLTTLRVPVREHATRRLTREEPPPEQYDLTKIEYKIVRHPEIMHEDGYEYPLGLARVEIPVPRADSAETGKAFEDEKRVFGSGDEADDFADASSEEELFDDGKTDAGSIAEQIAWEELYSQELRYLRFCYFDGHTWWDDWDITGENPLPQLVMVTIGFEGHAPFGEEFGRGENEEFCECLNEDPVDCEPLPSDQYSAIVRVSQADPLFRSRISREAQDFMRKLQGGEEQEEQEEEE